jgi:hypothetical protein
MEDVLRRLIFSVNCGVAWRALDDKPRRTDERAAACGDLKLQEKMTLKLRTEGAAGRSPSCAVAPIIMEMDDEQEMPKTRIRSLTRNQMSITSLGTGPRIRCTRGSPQLGHGPLVLAPIWLITPPAFRKSFSVDVFALLKCLCFCVTCAKLPFPVAMPRPKKPGQEEKEVKKRSRNGCW